MDMAEGNAADWATFAADNQPASVVDDSTTVQMGTGSLKFTTASGFDTGIAYPKLGNAHWDLTSVNYLTFWARAENKSPYGFQGDQPVIVLKSPAGSYTITPDHQWLTQDKLGQWVHVKVPLSGDAHWTLTSQGSPSLTDVNQLQIHQDTWDYGFDIYYDGIRFQTIDPNGLPPAGPPPPSGVNADQIDAKVLVFAFDPIMENMGGRRLHDVYGGTDASVLANAMVTDLHESSHGTANYQIVDTIIADEYPVQQDGFQYDDQTYDAAIRAKSFHDSPFDYNRFITDHHIAERIASGEIDEVWMYTGNTDAAKTWESTMAGDGAYWCNSPPVQGVSSDRAFVIMGLNFERGVAEELHSFGHRAENIMDHMYGGQSPNLDNNWNKFTFQDRYQAGNGGVGNVHYPVNGIHDYDYDNDTKVLSNADDWYNYPNFHGVTRLINAREWSPAHADAQREYLQWWYDHMPHFAGRGTDFYLNNWWRYIIDVDQFKSSNGNLYLTDGTPSVSIGMRDGSAFPPNVVTVEASASVEGALGRVDWYVDGVYRSTDTLAPYTFAWDARQAPGLHTLIAKAYELQNGTEAVSAPIKVTISDPWYNSNRPLDVDNDAHLAPNDALIIINYINSFGASPVPSDAVIGQPFGFLDTNCDNNVSPGDALDVINSINAGLGGEGEAQIIAHVADRLFADSSLDFALLETLDLGEPQPPNGQRRSV